MSDILRYRTLRLKFAVLHPLTECNPSALLNRLLSVFESAGIPLAMGKEKRPRPIAHLAYPLPIGVEGLGEWADVTLKAGLSDPSDSVMERLKVCCPEGLEILGIEQVPLHASPVAELCETARWLWNCRAELLPDAVSELKKFADSDSFQINKTGKLEGVKSIKSVEVRHLIQELNWDGGTLRFSTKIVQGQALNPQKLFAAILCVDPDLLGDFRRESIELRADPKLDRVDKFAPKLRNLYEDAVLLESAPNIKIVDDDDEDALLSL
jgi:radical SAM-linked protein